MAVPNQSFITEAPPLPEAEDSGASKNRSNEEMEAHMALPRENYRKLLEVAGQLNDQMRGLLEKEKQEFIAAYRAHTRKIQEDLARLRARVAEEEESLHRDEKVKRLQGDRDSYRAEALELDITNRALEAQLETIKAKLEVLEDDRNFLVRQLRTAREKAEAAKLAESSNSRPHTQGSISRVMKGLNTVELLKNLRKTIDESGDDVNRHQHLPPIHGDSPRLSMPSPGDGASNNFANALPISGKLLVKQKEVEAVQKAIASDKRQLEVMAREVGLVQRRRHANWLEALLVDCIRRIGDQVSERRRGNNEEAFGTSLSTAVSSWGEAPLRLERFTAPDRAAVLRLLLNDPRVQAALSKRRKEERQSPDTFETSQQNKTCSNEDDLEGPPARVSWMGGPGSSVVN